MHSNRLTDCDGHALVSQINMAPPEPGYSLRTPFNGWARERPTNPDAHLIQAVHTAVEAIGGFSKIIRPGDRITIKPNFNSGDPPPNSTDIPFLIALIRLLRDYGAGHITVGESTRHPPTNSRYEMQRTGVFDACRREGAAVAVFGDEHWTPVRTRGRRFGWVEVARPMLECDRLIFACCLKTHWLTKFSISLKLIVGAIRPRHRARLHFGGQIEARVAELASVVQPDLVLVDGRSVFVRGGPCYGIVRRPNVILASGDRIATDTAAIDVLRRYPECSLTDDPWTYRQIREAIRLGLGISGPNQRRMVIRDLQLSTGDDQAAFCRDAGSRPA
ncbi:MAG: DUF362 domain-containing protein [Dehalococcoidia bacterium]